MDNIRKEKYIYVPNFLTKEELSLLQPYCRHKAITEPDYDVQSIFSPSFYKDVIMVSLLHSKKKIAEDICGLKLHSTYAFWRAYMHGAILKDHIDRPSCEISATVNIDSCGTQWPIHMDGNWLNMNVGDAIFYLGCELTRGREPFKGDYCPQVFLHYVDANGPYSIFKEDQINNLVPRGDI